MNKRQTEVEKAKLAAEENELKHLKAIYNKAASDISKKISISNGKINVLLAEFDDLDEVQKSILQSQIYQRDFQKSLQKQIDGFLKDLNDKQYESVNEYLKDSYKTGYIGTMYDIAGQGIPFVIPIDQKQVTKAMTHDTKLSKRLYTRLGEDVDLLKKRVANNISRGIATADSYSNIARNISNGTNVSINRTMTIARTEGHRIQVQATNDAQHDAKDKGADVVKQWDSTLDGKTRPHHRQLDGQIRELDEPFEVDGMEVMYPSDFGRPGEDINCRCALIQRARWALGEEELEALKERAAYFGLDKAKDFDDYKKKYLKATENVKSDEQSIDNGFAYVKTVEEAKSALKNTVGLRNVDESINFMDEKLLVENTNQLIRLENIFGAIEQSEFVDIDLDNGKFIGKVTSDRIWPTSQYLTLNKKHYSDRSYLIEKEINGVESGFSMPFLLTDEEIAVASITHEYGHILQNTIKKNYMESLGWSQSDVFSFVNKKAKTKKAKYKWYADVQKKVQDDCYDEIISIAKKNNPLFDLDANISDYGKESKDEFFAEVFMNSQLSKPNELGIAMNEWLEVNILSKRKNKSIDPAKAVKTIDDINNEGTNMVREIYERHRIRNNLNQTPIDKLTEGGFENIVGAKYGKMSVESATAFNETIKNLVDEYDTPLNKIRTMTKDEFVMKRNSFAYVVHNYSVDSAELVINPTKCKDIVKLTDRIKELSQNGYCVKIPDEAAGKYVATHEFAHTLLNLDQPLNKKANWMNADYDKITKARNEIKEVYEQYMDEVEAITAKQKEVEFEAMTTFDESAWKKAADLTAELNSVKLSNYSIESADEFLAEAFANEKIGITPNKYSEQVIDILDKYFKW